MLRSRINSKGGPGCRGYGGRKGVGGWNAGMTLVEVLVSVAVAGIVLASFGSTFLGAIHTYRLAGIREGVAFELQRAVLDTSYFISQAVSVRFEDDAEISGLYGVSADLSGTRMRLGMADGSEVTIEFAPNLTASAGYSSGGWMKGSLSVSVGGTSYVYSSEVYGVFSTAGVRPFALNSTGNVVYGWGMATGLKSNFGVDVGGTVVYRPPLMMFGGVGVLGKGA